MNKLALRPRVLAAGGVALVIAFGAGYALAAQPHMEAALGDLQAAKAQLAAAVADKGGHRVKAMTLVDEAIGEVQAGIAYAAGH